MFKLKSLRQFLSPRRQKARIHGQRLKSGYLDLLLLGALFLLNPVLHGFRYPSNLTPDAISYLTLAQDLLSAGKLFIASSGHVDTGLIIPPLYPFLIGIASLVSDNTINNAEWISAACMLLVTIPLFLLVKRDANRYVAFAAVFLFQFNGYYVFFASSILTEALFLLILISALYLAVRLTETKSPRGVMFLALGVLAGLLFLARQIGITFLIFLLMWFAADAWLRDPARRRNPTRGLALIVAGWVVIVGGYAVALFAQTGVSPFHHHFRMHNYVVQTADASVIDEARRISGMEEKSYVDIYAKRRLLWKLLPDGSEMLAYAVGPDGASIANTGNKDDGIAQAALDRLGSAGVWLTDFFKNVWHLKMPLGTPLFVLMIASFITPFLLPETGRRWSGRLIIPAFVCLYILGVSIFTANVSRYLIVLYPLALIQIALELAIGARRWRSQSSTIKKLPDFVVALILAALIVLFPRTFYETPRHPPDSINLASWSELKARVNAGDPVFALLPVYPYLAGGRHRILPNDSLEKTVHYARLTGVRWLLVPKHPDRFPEIRFHTHAGWLYEPEKLHLHTDLLRFCCAQDDEHLLFEIVR